MRPGDFGPIYAETVLGRFPVEPWNTASNIFFLILIVYLIRRSAFDFRRYPLVVIAIPILTVGFIGGTVFHATRSNSIWLRLDYMPIFILSLLAAYHFWKEFFGSTVRAAIALLAVFICVRLPWYFSALPIGLRIGVGYSGLALALIVPALLVCAREKWVDWRYLAAATLSFAGAITFRTIDKGLGAELLPMGTHFLWHTLGALSVYLMFEFVLRRYDRLRTPIAA